jgi:hypothetical protein
MVEGTMKTIELKPEDFPVTVQLHISGGIKQYVLVKTKQEKLLLNKPLAGLQSNK